MHEKTAFEAVFRLFLFGFLDFASRRFFGFVG